MAKFRRVPAIPERVNVHRPTAGHLVDNPAVPPDIPLAQQQDLTRSYERMNDLLGEPGDRALQWRDLGDYLYGRGIGADETCQGLALSILEGTVDTANKTLLSAPLRGVFNFENLPWVEYRPYTSDGNFQYPDGVDLRLPWWGGDTGTLLPNNIFPSNFDLAYNQSKETFSDQVGDAGRNRIVRLSYPFRDSNPKMLPEVKVNPETGVSRSLVVYESDGPSVPAIRFFATNGIIDNTGNSEFSCLLRQVAGPALGTNSNITLNAVTWRAANNRNRLIDRTVTVPFDSNGRGFLSFTAGNLSAQQLVSPMLIFGAGIASGVRVEIHFLFVHTRNLARIG